METNLFDLSIEKLYEMVPSDQKVPFHFFQKLGKEIIVYAIQQNYPIPKLFIQNGDILLPIKQSGINFFNQVELSKIHSEDMFEIIEYFEKIALENGFKLCRWDGKNDIRCRLYCEKGGRIRNCKKTKKTKCPFIIKITKNSSNEYYIFKKSILSHNHNDYEPTRYLSVLQEGTKNVIIKRLGTILTPTQIQDIIPIFAPELNLTTFDIAQIIHKKKLENYLPETLMLQDFVEKNGGKVFSFDIGFPEKVRRIAILTIMDYELHNLDCLSDIIQIDGTQLPTHQLRWEMTPITLLDNDCRIRSGGVLFSAMMDKTIINWLIHNLYTLKEFHCKTIITDEDSAYIYAFKELNAEGINFNHLLCAKHKENNHNKKLNEFGLSKDQKKTASLMFHSICYDNNPEVVDELIEKLQTIHPKIEKYMEENVIPLNTKFAKSKINVFTKGINTTSNAESRNRMIKCS